MHQLSSSSLVFCLLGPGVRAQTKAPAEKPLPGFTCESSLSQKQLEAKFDSRIRRKTLRALIKRLPARPLYIGWPYGKETADFTASLFKSWGYGTEVESFDVLFPTPKTRVPEMIASERFTAKLAEPALAEDATSNQQSEQLPIYNAYSIDGDVAGGLVYVNYARRLIKQRN